MVGMVETVTGASSRSALTEAAQLLHDFNVEYDKQAPTPDELAARLAQLVAADHVTVLLARTNETGPAIGFEVTRVQPSVWSPASEAYLAELYVVPRERGADYAFLVTSEDDRLAQRIYEAAGFHQTEGDGGPHAGVRA